MPLESNLASSVLKYLNSLPGCVAEKVRGDSTASGRPDINGCFRGRSFRIELKTPDHKNVPSKKQLYNLDKWQMSGAIVMVAYSLEFVKKIFKPSGLDTAAEFLKTFTSAENNNCYSTTRIPNLSEFLWVKNDDICLQNEAMGASNTGIRVPVQKKRGGSLH